MLVTAHPGIDHTAIAREAALFIDLRGACNDVALLDASADADVVVLVTAHPGIDHASLAKQAALFIDLRGVTRGIDIENLVTL